MEPRSGCLCRWLPCDCFQWLPCRGGNRAHTTTHARSKCSCDTWNGREIHCSTQREGVNESLWVSLHVSHGRRRGRHHLFGFRPLNGGREARFIIAKSGTNAERDATEKIPIGARRTAPLGSLCVNNKKPLAVASDACHHPPLPPPPSPLALLDATTRRHYHVFSVHHT